MKSFLLSSNNKRALLALSFYLVLSCLATFADPTTQTGGVLLGVFITLLLAVAIAVSVTAVVSFIGVVLAFLKIAPTAAPAQTIQEMKVYRNPLFWIFLVFEVLIFHRLQLNGHHTTAFLAGFLSTLDLISCCNIAYIGHKSKPLTTTKSNGR